MKEETNELDLIPECDLEQWYEGKIMVMEFRGRHYLRGILPTQSYHKDIIDSFTREVRDQGFLEDICEKGGGRVEFYNENKLIIYGKSTKYGKCDKAVAKEILERRFPGKTVSIQ